MPYLRDVRNSLLIAHDQGLVSDEELSLQFRVSKKDLPLLADALRLPVAFHCNQRTTADKLEGLCILLRRMSFPDAISNKGAALQNCFGFIDGTIRPICRPSQEQRIMFNGHKRVHSLKFQSVAVPNGLIANLFGPVG